MDFYSTCKRKEAPRDTFNMTDLSAKLSLVCTSLMIEQTSD